VTQDVKLGAGIPTTRSRPRLTRRLDSHTHFDPKVGLFCGPKRIRMVLLYLCPEGNLFSKRNRFWSLSGAGASRRLLCNTKVPKGSTEMKMSTATLATLRAAEGLLGELTLLSNAHHNRARASAGSSQTPAEPSGSRGRCSTAWWSRTPPPGPGRSSVLPRLKGVHKKQRQLGHLPWQVNTPLRNGVSWHGRHEGSHGMGFDL
jgi:hypothetical protein